MTARGKAAGFVLCLSNRGFKASLVPRKVYRLVPDAEATSRGMLRIIDESGEDYLFPARLFAALDLPKEVRQRLAR